MSSKMRVHWEKDREQREIAELELLAALLVALFGSHTSPRQT